jgi:glycosyltransferase involved in cell wall biosynthesis
LKLSAFSRRDAAGSYLALYREGWDYDEEPGESISEAVAAAVKQVAILQRVLPHYRVPVFDKLAAVLRSENVNIKVIYGQEYPGTVPKTVTIKRPWATFVRNTYFKLGRLEVVWQHILPGGIDADLVIFEHANRLINNYPLLFFRKEGRKVAYWGHGRNLQSPSYGVFERWKRWHATKVDWWFAYTDMSRKIIVDAGFSQDRVTVVQNSIETTALRKALAKVTASDVRELKNRLGITTDNVGLYCGGMYADKKLNFLLNACQGIKRDIPDFQMIIVGNGQEQYKLAKMSAAYSWIHYPGPKFGADVAPYFAISKALLMPGLVGLAIVDSFITRTPLFTTNIPIHSPEIEYLEDGVNGVMTDHSVDAFVKAVVNYLQSVTAQEKLKKECGRSAKIYNVENMVSHFVRGIKACLGN